MRNHRIKTNRAMGWKWGHRRSPNRNAQATKIRALKKIQLLQTGAASLRAGRTDKNQERRQQCISTRRLSTQLSSRTKKSVYWWRRSRTSTTETRHLRSCLKTSTANRSPTRQKPRLKSNKIPNFKSIIRIWMFKVIKILSNSLKNHRRWSRNQKKRSWARVDITRLATESRSK